MARTINSPGVQITETDLSNNITIGGATNVFVAGFAPQGPIDEVISVTTASELEQIYGIPKTPAERYFYYTCREILNSPGNLLTTRLPYGSGSGEGFATTYSALLYPVLSTETGNFRIGEPKHITFGEETYNNVVQNNLTWSSVPSAANLTTTYIPSLSSGMIDAGIIIINEAQTTVNEFFEGYYISITDNSNFGPDTDFDSVVNIKSLAGSSDFYTIPAGRLGFELSAVASSAGTQSVSEAIESIPTYNLGDLFYRDSLILNVIKVRNSIYEPQNLVYSISESHIGSLDANKKSVASIGGIKKSFYLGDIVNNSSNNLKIFINPAISQRTNWSDLSSNNPSKEVRVNNDAKNLYVAGVYAPTYSLEKDKTTGRLIQKLERALTHIETTETIPVDVIVDGGLTTIFATLSSAGGYYNDNTFINTTSLNTETSPVLQSWRTCFNVFNNFVQNVRRDCVFISDPLRQIFVNGEDTKTLSVRGNNFSTNVYVPLKNSYSSINSNYAAAYGNWIKSYDAYADRQVWLPASGFVAAIYSRTDATTQPWIAPAGLNRGILNNVIDLAINPNQKQRDFLYTISINPIVAFAGEGFAIYGQKTLQNKPSAFDRVNVRRLFLTLERSVQNALKYFVFEPNTQFTRTRLKNTIVPVFELAKNTEGLYDYLIVCDSRNNTPDIIDRNELVVDIYIKPVRTAEFILVNFIATRTSQSFQELI